MNLTETEAGTKWCPFSRAMLAVKTETGADVKAYLPSFNRFAFDNDSGALAKTSPPACRCIASHCMAWRLDGDGKEVARTRTTIRRDDGSLEYLAIGKAPTDPGWESGIADEAGTVMSWVRQRSPRGYCGLTGGAA